MKTGVKQIRFFTITIAVIILLIFLHTINVLKPLENGVLYILRPIERTIATIAENGNDFFTTIGRVNSLKQDNEKLKSELNDMIIKNNKLELLIKESSIVAKESQFLTEKEYQYKLTHIIGQSPDPQSKILIIDVGKNDGIAEGQAVVADEGILVGKIFEVENNTAKVLLLTDPRSRILALVQNENSSQGIISGTYGLTLIMDWITKNDIVIQGQYVITSGLEEKISKGLIIGQVEKISLKTGELFQSATIKPLIDFDKLQILAVIIS